METKTVATKTKWTIDPMHSEILFKVKHLMITNVKGEFRKFQAELLTDGDDFDNAAINLTIDAGSIDTNETNRDAHLKGPDFFDVENHPHLNFKGTTFRKIDDKNYELKGMLAIKGVSKEVILRVELGGFMKDLYGNEKAGFSIEGTLNRKDFGLNWNAALETGGVLVSDEVKITAEVQFIKEQNNT